MCDVKTLCASSTPVIYAYLCTYQAPAYNVFLYGTHIYSIIYFSYLHEVSCYSRPPNNLGLVYSLYREKDIDQSDQLAPFAEVTLVK